MPKRVDGLQPEELERRWSRINEKILANAAILRQQGGLIRKKRKAGHSLCLRFIDRRGDRPIHRTIFVAREIDSELVDRVRHALQELRQTEQWCSEVRMFSKLAGALRFLCDRRVVRRRSSQSLQATKDCSLPRL